MAAAARLHLSHLHRPPSSSPGQKSAVPGFLRSGALNYAGPHRSQTPGKTGGFGAASYQNCGGSTCFGTYVDELLSYTVGSSRYFVHSNHLFSPSAVTNAAGQVQERYRYDAYGKQTITTATGTTRNQSAVGFSRGFTGYILDEETGLYYARARMYSAGLGRFIGRDPLGRQVGLLVSAKGGGGIESALRVVAADTAYVEGMNVFAAYFAPNGVDPEGTEDADQTPSPPSPPPPPAPSITDNPAMVDWITTVVGAAADGLSPQPGVGTVYALVTDCNAAQLLLTSVTTTRTNAAISGNTDVYTRVNDLHGKISVYINCNCK